METGLPLEAADQVDDVAELPPKEPANVTALSQKDAAADIEDILGDDLQIEDPAPDDEDKTAEDVETDPLGLDDAEDVGKEDDEDEDGPQEATAAGQYVSPKAKYKLADGTEITVGELARNNLFQRDYSQKTEETAREKAEYLSRKAEIDQVSQKVSEEREFLIWFAEQNVPKVPTAPIDPNDPMAEIEYARAMRQYNLMAESWRAFKNGQQQDEQRKAGETQAEANKRGQKEVSTLFEKIPMLKDNKKAKTFFDTLETAGAEHYGLTQDEIATATKQDHRYILILRDALAHRRAKAAAPQLQKELAKKPVTVKGSAQRGSQQQVQQRSKKQASDELRATGSMRAGIAAIEALIS